jgi:hypothetical protein
MGTDPSFISVRAVNEPVLPTVLKAALNEQQQILDHLTNWTSRADFEHPGHRLPAATLT